MNFKKIIAYIMILAMICTLALNTTDFYTIKANAETVTPDITVQSTFFEGNTVSISVTTSPQDNFVGDNTWTQRPTAVEGGVYVNGELKTGVVLIKLADRYYISLSDGGVKAAEGMTVVFDGIYEDTTGYRVKFDKATFEYTDGAWQQIFEEEVTTVTVESTFLEGNSVSVSVTTTPTDNFAYDDVNWSVRPTAVEGGVYVNGVLNAGVQLIKLSNRYYISLSDGGVRAAEGMTVVFDGTYQHSSVTNYQVKFKKATFKYTNGAWKQVYEPNVTVESTLNDGDSKYLFITTSPADNFAGDETWAQRPIRLDGGVYVDGELKTGIALIKFTNRYGFYLPDGGVTATEGTTVVFDGTYKDMNGADYIVKFEKAIFKYTNGAWKQIYEPDVTVKSTLLDGDATSIRFTTTPNDDFIGDESWTQRPISLDGGVYVDGVLNTGCTLIKFTNNYYIYLAGGSVTATEGTTVVIDGTYKDMNGADYIVKFAKATFKYTNGAWVQLNDNGVVQTGVVGDANADNTTNLLDFISISKYIANSAEAVNFNDADINQDGDLDTDDLILMKKMLLGIVA